MEKANIISIILLMIATSLGYFTVQLDVSIVNVSLPTIQTNLMASLSELQWIVNIYILIFSSTLLSAGILGDRYGSKYLLIAGYLTLLIGSILCATTHSIIYMLVFRAVQGMGAAIIVSNSLAIINKKFIHNKPLRTTLITIWMSFDGVALTCGPIFGGIITSLFNWRYIFLINIPICLIGVLCTIFFVAKETTSNKQKNDFQGQFWIFISSGLSLLLIINFTILNVIEIIIIGILLLISIYLFISKEKSILYPAIPLYIFKNTELQRALIYGFLVNFIYFGMIFLSAYFS